MDANEQDAGLVGHYHHLVVGWARVWKRQEKRDERKY